MSVWRKGPPKKQGDWWVRNGIGAVWCERLSTPFGMAYIKSVEVDVQWHAPAVQPEFDGDSA